MKLTTKVARLLDATPGVHIHKGRLRIALKVPGRTTPARKSLGLPPTEANIIYAGNKLSAMKIDVQTGNYTADEAAFWHKHLPDDPRHNIVNRTLRHYFNLYLAARQHDLAYSTLTSIRTALNFLEGQQVLDRDVRDISHRDLEAIRNRALLTRKATTLRGYFRSIRAVLDEAIKDGYIDQSPFTHLRRLRETGDDQDPAEQVMPFTKNEITRLLDACVNEQHRQMIGLLYWTGMRPGEMKALAWEDIDLEAGTARVRYNLSRDGYIKPPKTAAGVRTIELLPAAIEILKKQRALTYMLPAQKDEVRFLHNKRRIEYRRRVFLSHGKPFQTPILMTTPGTWASLLRKAKLAHRESYQLRHSYASIMLMLGAHPAYLATQMGHADWGMIRKVYAKWLPTEHPRHRDELVAKLQEFDPYMTPDVTADRQVVDDKGQS